MKLLFDENLSRRLVVHLEDLFAGSSHVVLEGLARCSDKIIREFAAKNEFAIVTADSDFYEMATVLGPPPKVIWLTSCDYPTAIAEKLIRRESTRIAEFGKDPDRSVLILKP
jgi:predicted nuclease of predicted toxin-antitoxin system